MGEAKNRRAKGLIEATRHRAFEARNGLYVPRVEGDHKTHWPTCLQCHQDVERVNVEEQGKDSVTIRAWCHGEEATIRIDFPYRIEQRSDDETWHHIRTAMNAAVFFDPSLA